MEKKRDVGKKNKNKLELFLSKEKDKKVIEYVDIEKLKETGPKK